MAYNSYTDFTTADEDGKVEEFKNKLAPEHHETLESLLEMVGKAAFEGGYEEGEADAAADGE
jgi:hypothetical protein